MKFLSLAVLAIVVLVQPCRGAAKPNVVFIMADDLGWADITPYGSTFHETPNLQRLAKRAVRFTNCYAASPLCSPTRSSILTGLYPARTGITAPVCHLPVVQLEKRLLPCQANQRVQQAESLTRMKGEYVTLAEAFKEAGYATAHFGKWHLGFGAGYEPKDQGFDLDVPHTPQTPSAFGGYFAPWSFVSDPRFKAKAGEHIDEWLAGQAAKYIDEHKDKPFYLNFWLYSVHSPWNAKKELVEHFKKTADPKAAQRNPLYAAMVKTMDDAVGKLLDALDAAKLTDNTIIVFTSDNGGYAYPLPFLTDPPGYQGIPVTSNAPLRSGKASNYEGGTRVPLLIACPGRTKPAVRDALFSSVDWLPTLLAMTGVKANNLPKTDGVDQTPAILEGKSVRDTVYVHFPHGNEAIKGFPGMWPGTWVRKGRWKLIRFYAKNDDQSDCVELYDLQADIGEANNLVVKKPARVKELSGLIDAFLKDTEAVVPKANPKYRVPPRGK